MNAKARPGEGASPAASVERERKFESAWDARVPRLRGVGPVSVQGGPREQSLEATYFDTVDYRLARRGITMRRRTGGVDEGWHVKFPTAHGHREELQIPLERSQKKPPAQVKRLVSATTRGAALVPIARIHTWRSAFDLLDAKGTILAVLTDDRVTAQKPDLDARDAEWAHRWREFEIELTDVAKESLLKKLATGLRDQDIDPAGWSSKLSRVIGDDWPQPMPPPATPVGKHSSAGEVALDYLRRQTQALYRHDVGVRRDADDAIHQMRVATRRLRAALTSLRRILDRSATKELADELRWLAGELAAARDLEVQHHHLSGQLDALPGDPLGGDPGEHLQRYFQQRRTKARDAALTALGSARYFRLLDSLDDLVESPPLTARARRRANTELRHALRRAHRKLAEAITPVDRDTPPSDETLHNVRKRAKQARYTVDAMNPAFGGKVRKWGKAAKKIQSSLGEHQDARVARDTLRDLAAHPHDAATSAFNYGILYARNQPDTSASGHQVTRRWKQMRGNRPGWLK
jgi:CHAD domain-containing protein